MDVDFPCDLVQPIEEYVSMSDITFMAERYARNVGQENGMFVCNGFMVCPSRHPIMKRVIDSLPENITHTVKFEADWIMTGPMLLNRAIYGVVTVIPFKNDFIIPYIESPAINLELNDS